MTAPMGGQYASAAPFFGKDDSNVVSVDDQNRIKAYRLYEAMYHNQPGTFLVTMRGQDDDQTPIYLPTVRRIVEATNRFLGVEFDFVVDPNLGSPEQQKQADLLMGNLFKREKIYTKFTTQKRYGLIRGDQLWHVTADPDKEEGSRVSVHILNPSQYFPIEDPDNTDRVIGCHIVDLVQDPREPNDPSKQVARRQTYLRKGAVLKPGGKGYTYDKTAGAAGSAGITSEVTLWEIGTWDDRNLEIGDMKKVGNPVPLFELPPDITTIPVYHIKNNEIPDETFGMSEAAGVESIVNGLNQSVSDEDLTLVMQGLGMYWTDAGPPLNPDGSEASWEIGPRTVAEVGEGQTFGRVSGVSTTAPYQEHMQFIEDQAMKAAGVPAIAAGKTDTAIAQSGIALKLEMLPMTAKNAEKEQEILSIWDQMLHDILHQWFAAFEGFTAPEVSVASVVGDPMPVDRTARIKELQSLFASGLLTIQQVQTELNKYGYNFVEGDAQQVLNDAAALAAAQTGDPMANRYAQEMPEGHTMPSPPQGGTSARAHEGSGVHGGPDARPSGPGGTTSPGVYGPGTGGNTVG